MLFSLSSQVTIISWFNSQLSDVSHFLFCVLFIAYVQSLKSDVSLDLFSALTYLVSSFNFIAWDATLTVLKLMTTHELTSEPQPLMFKTFYTASSFVHLIGISNKMSQLTPPLPDTQTMDWWTEKIGRKTLTSITPKKIYRWKNKCIKHTNKH